MREYQKIILVAGLTALAVLWAVGRNAPSAPAGAIRNPATAPAEPDPLNAMIPDVHFDKMPLTLAMDRLAELSNTNIVIDWNDLEEANIKRNVTVTGRLRNISLSSGLRMLFLNTHLAYGAEEGVIMITASNDHFALVARVYDIRDIIVGIGRRDYRIQHEYEVARGLEPGEAADLKERKFTCTRNEAINETINQLTETVAPHTWRENGGRGSLREVNSCLIVYQTPEVHRRVAQELDAIRRELK